MSASVWRAATIVGATPQTSTARSLRLSVPGLGRAIAGQHVDVRLTADDGYQAVRSYSLSDVRGATSGAAVAVTAQTEVDGQTGVDVATEVEITVEELPDGEVSPYLVEAAEVGDALEVRGPIGGWFVWPPRPVEPGSAVHAVLPDPAGAPAAVDADVQLIAGGSGVAPLMAMIRSRVATRASSAPRFRLLYSLRTPESRWFADELDAAARSGAVEVTEVYTRRAPVGHDRTAGRLDAQLLAELALPAEGHPVVYVCGPTAFVEAVGVWLVEAGHDPTRVRLERFGG